MDVKIVKNKKIVLGSIVSVGVIGAALAIALPITLRETTDNRTEIEKHFEAIVNASDKSASEKAALIFYGIKVEANAEKAAVDSAKALADYIFKNKATKTFSVHQKMGNGQMATQVAIVVKSKSDPATDSSSGSSASSAASSNLNLNSYNNLSAPSFADQVNDPWYAEFVVGAEFLLLQDFVLEQSITSNFIAGSVKSDPTKMINGFKTKIYYILDTFKKSVAATAGWDKTTYKTTKLADYKFDAKAKSDIAQWIFTASGTTTKLIKASDLTEFVTAAVANVEKKELQITYKIGILTFTKKLDGITGIFAQKIVDELNALAAITGGVEVATDQILPTDNAPDLNGPLFNQLLKEKHPNLTIDSVASISFTKGVINQTNKTVTYNYKVTAEDGTKIENAEGVITLKGYITDYDVAANEITVGDVKQNIIDLSGPTKDKDPSTYVNPGTVRVTKWVGPKKTSLTEKNGTTGKEVVFVVTITKWTPDKPNGKIEFTFKVLKQWDMSKDSLEKKGELTGFAKS